MSIQLLKVVEYLDEKSQECKLSKVPYEDVFRWRPLKLLRNTLSETIFNAFLKNYVDSLPKRIFEEGNTWTVDEYELGIEDNQIKCACRYAEKCGIPCSHLIKVIVTAREDIQNYIHQRWKVSAKKSKSIYRIPKGRPRDSRRQ